ncbi:DMT family transporter [Aureimonas sp. N4]|uniref:DMT family transporter n=1 Tax=Aureimonas sp. N4 TaxID=1638165 RepID=UPI00078375C2|nr:DMT family transporter [Aureimonas sp. N4]
MNASGSSLASENARASLLMTGAMACFALNDMMVKTLSASMEAPQIMALRGVIVSCLLIALGLQQGVLRPLSRLRHRAVLLRTLADILTTISYISALKHLSLGNASAIFQALPFTITIGAALFLGESVGWRRWVAIAVGFVGVLVILRPATDGFNTYAVWVLISVVFAAMRDLVTRRMPTSISSLQVATVTSIAVAITGFLMLPAVGWSPVSGASWLILLCGAFAIGAGYIMIVASMRVGDMSFVAPFRYSILIFAMALGALVFEERPDGFEILGSLIVVGSGAYTIHREGVARRAARAGSTGP